ncbi:DNA-binding protein [Salinirubellus salinus]|uniref:DNA-binding protein n=1 Tax=Salinirubellus salinus TaxID=1364945 RepID=A0A9E7R5F4_9EURY|nr:DNA-binding protein [Salinirubellus salinus]UWM55073.1 DNA-binding protein [Salinirubellus salinus]
MAAEPESEWAGETADVTAEEPPVAVCVYCSRPFRRTRYYHLHLGVEHGEDLDATEREAYEAADEAESEELFVYHLKVVAALSTTWAVFVLGYMVFGV